MVQIVVKPGSKKTGVAKLSDGTLVVKVSAKPEKSKANRAVIEALAEYYQISPSKIMIERGETSSRKLISIQDF